MAFVGQRIRNTWRRGNCGHSTTRAVTDKQGRCLRHSIPESRQAYGVMPRATGLFLCFMLASRSCIGVSPFRLFHWRRVSVGWSGWLVRVRPATANPPCSRIPACCAVGGVTPIYLFPLHSSPFPLLSSSHNIQTSAFSVHSTISLKANRSRHSLLITRRSRHSLYAAHNTLARSNNRFFLIHQPSPCLPSRTFFSPWHSPPLLLRKAKSQTVKFRLPHPLLPPPFLRSQMVRSRLPPKFPR